MEDAIQYIVHNGAIVYIPRGVLVDVTKIPMPDTTIDIILSQGVTIFDTCSENLTLDTDA